MILKKILVELQQIKKELHDLQKNMEPKKEFNPDILQKVIEQANFLQKTTGRNPFLLD